MYRELDFWTSGFFPGCLHLLLERQRKYPRFISPSLFSGLPQTPHPLQLQYACKWWTIDLHQNARVHTTHDLSFMISPWARLSWELDHDAKAYETLITAAQTLATRYNVKTECLRSWDTCVTNRYSFMDQSLDFLVIIVSLPFLSRCRSKPCSQVIGQHAEPRPPLLGCDRARLPKTLRHRVLAR